MSDFIRQCLAGNALLDDIDDYIDDWHKSDSTLPLYKYLGMTHSEYSLWIADPDVLPFIVKAHLQGRDVADLLEEINALPLAARSDGPEKATELMKWLKNEGLWE